MNLRQQFFWKVIIGFSLILILFYSFQTYQNYNQFSKYQKEYKRELQVKENKDLQNKADYVSSKQNARNSLEINILEIQKDFITNHTRAGIKVNNNADFGSKDPIFKGMVNKDVLIDYRDKIDGRYKLNQYIVDGEEKDLKIISITKDSVLIEYSNKDVRAFYSPSKREKNNN
ncbi:MAG: hypothetical protein CL869_00595 [Cytophagia bacterium]|nr:hypothetical protein [Cytophagia bacterium]|tara:strand:+ start:8637 stop:9155 length:519 start_codon:yes stop_codon:yes gene_type:complete